MTEKKSLPEFFKMIKIYHVWKTVHDLVIFKNTFSNALPTEKTGKLRQYARVTPESSNFN